MSAADVDVAYAKAEATVRLLRDTIRAGRVTDVPSIIEKLAHQERDIALSFAVAVLAKARYEW